MVGFGRGYGHKQITSRCLTILKIINALSKAPHTYTQLHTDTKIQRNILRKILDLLASEGMITQNDHSVQRERYPGKRKYYALNLSHPIIVVVNKKELKVNIVEQISNLVFKNSGKSTHTLDDNNTLTADNEQESNLSITKRSLIQPPKDENPNAISKQFEYLIEDIRYFVDNFLKHYYPPKTHQPYYARAVWLLRQLFKQYSDSRYHRDLYDWSEIYLANKGLHPSGKSSKELSARYGEKIRRYNKFTGEPIFGRKGISKKHIQRKSQYMANYLQEFHKLIPLFLFMHRLFKDKKEKLIVDHVIDRNQSKDIRKR